MKNTGKVIACLKALGDFKPSINRFEDRLKIQKMVYLLELKGLNLGFGFGPYVRGPYSPDLTKEIYGRQGDFEKLRTDVELTAKEVEAVRELKELFQMKSSLLEVAATYGYYVHAERLDPITALKNVKKVKSFYSEAQIAIGISRAKEYLFPPSQEAIDSMKKEMRAWEAAANSDAEN